MYQYLIACSATDETDKWAMFSIAVGMPYELKTIDDIYRAQPIVKEVAENFFGLKYKDFFILMFHELEEEKNDRNTETNTAE